MKKLTAQQEAEQRFPADIAAHKMTVKHHDGLYRHLYFGRPGTGNMSFSIVTWPGYLAYSGDMGDFVFCRMYDMFQFFRHARPNYSYWAEKVQAQDKADGLRQYSAALAREWVEERMADGDAPDSARAQADDIDYENGAVRFYDSVQDIGWRGFDDLGDATIEEFTGRFVWCCNALVWAIQQYDLWQDQQRAAR